MSLEKFIHKEYSSTGSLICQNRESLVNFFLLFKALTIPFVYEMDLEIKPLMWVNFYPQQFEMKQFRSHT